MYIYITTVQLTLPPKLFCFLLGRSPFSSSFFYLQFASSLVFNFFSLFVSSIRILLLTFFAMIALKFLFVFFVIFFDRSFLHKALLLGFPMGFCAGIYRKISATFSSTSIPFLKLSKPRTYFWMIPVLWHVFWIFDIYFSYLIEQSL